MRILLLTHSYWPDVSPPQRRWSAFTRVFAESGHDVDVVAPKVLDEHITTWQSRPEPPLGVSIHRYPSFRKPYTMWGKLVKHLMDAIRSVPTALATPKPQVVIATVPSLPTLAVGYTISLLRRVPFVVDLRDAWPDLLQDSQVLRFSWLEPIVSRVLTFMIHRSNLVVTVSEGLALKLESEGARRSVSISNGVDADHYGLDIVSMPRGNKLRVLYLGNLGRSQGLELAVRAVAKIKDKVELRIVGQGTERQNLESLALQLGVDVDFRNPVYGPRVADNYAWADTCLVSLRADWESFEHTIPSKLYELLLLDRHITGLVRGEAAEIIRSSGAGQVVDQDEKHLVNHFHLLHADRDLLKTGHTGSNWVRQHASLTKLGRRYLTELGQLTQ